MNLLTCVAKDYYKKGKVFKKTPGVIDVSAFLISVRENQYPFVVLWFTAIIR